MMATQTSTASQHNPIEGAGSASSRRSDDVLRQFVPPRLFEVLQLLLNQGSRLGLDVWALFDDALNLGEEVIDLGLESAVNYLETVYDRVHDSGLLERLGMYSPIVRDGAEMGSKALLQALRTLEPADVAKITAIALVALARPDLFAIHRVAYAEIALESLSKVWSMS